jgi:MEMO1 family protein
MIREPVVAGQFYPSNKDELTLVIKQSINKVIIKKNHNNILGAIIPHAGYMYSGSCAAHSYSMIKNNKDKIDVFIILGFSHSGYGNAEICLSQNDWKTPLGICQIDNEISNQLLNNNIATINENAHNYEHSIEVQLPFLQYLFKDFTIVPLSISSRCDFKKMGEKIANVIKNQNKKICVIASSDFTHYGPNFKYVPFTDNIKENLEKLDMGAIKFIKDLNSNGFIDYINQTSATICGQNPIALQIEIMKNLNAKKGELINYCTSGDLTGDYSNSVSYVSLIFK